jgi:protein-tyrosine phosphatase
MRSAFVDIHCHILPGIDDGARDWDESVAMAKLAAADGTTTIIATPHQLGGYGCNQGDATRQRVVELRQRLADTGVPLEVFPGADVRIDEKLIEQLLSGNVLTLGDHGRHVLLELPHELYFPLESLVERLARHDLVPILSHPERNEGILRRPAVLESLVECGCLLQITAGSLCGSFGEPCQYLAELLVLSGLVHFVATDGHGAKSRRPVMRRAFECVSEIAGAETAIALCCANPALVASGQRVVAGRSKPRPAHRTWWRKKSAA